MKIRSQTYSALKALMDLSEHATVASPAPLGDIARRQGLSLGLLEQLFRRLKKAALVEPARGTRGGYRLARRPDKVRLLDVFQALDEPASRPFAGRGSRDAQSMVLEAAFARLGKAVEKEMASISLADLRREWRATPGERGLAGAASRFSI